MQYVARAPTARRRPTAQLVRRTSGRPTRRHRTTVACRNRMSETRVPVPSLRFV